MKRLWNKTTRRILILTLSLILGYAGVALQQSIVKKQTTTERVVVAAETILPYGTLAGKLTTRAVVKSEVPDDAIRDLAELDGQEWFAGEIGFVEGMPLRKSLLVTAKDSKFGQALALKDGRMLIGLQTDQVRSAGDSIKPGTVADAYVYIPGTPETPARTITPADDPNLKGLLVVDRQNHNGYEPQKDGSNNQNPIPAIAIIETDKPSVAAALIRYQEEGKVYLVPTGVQTDRKEEAA
ncbi:MAG: hypothetical protein BAA01_11425 [Bacillus thermozeamaize]|uniref:Flp pilus assembly protein CpaB n=1 Tax=Bacillus thermozeamaize TaxID=230954 RepID=A0A1Y3PGY6_9BACI|nr:MAG: hypothetical protein BAA01_11425 [Bacillus thermozeamaize]